MTLFAFSATVTGLDLEDLAQLDALYTRAFVVVPGEVDGVVSLDVEIDAASGEDALLTFAQHLKTVDGLAITRVDVDLVNITEIATRLGLSREAVRLLSVGARGDGDFPLHRHVVGSQKVWAWSDVYAWAAVHARLTEEEPAPIDAACVDWYNGLLVPAVEPQPDVYDLGAVRLLVMSQWASQWSYGREARLKFESRRTVFTARSGVSWQQSAAGQLERVGS